MFRDLLLQIIEMPYIVAGVTTSQVAHPRPTFLWGKCQGLRVSSETPLTAMEIGALS